MPNNFDRRGIGLVETMVALLILVVISSAVILMTLEILSLTNASRLKNQATTYAEEMVEKVRDAYQNYGYSAISAKGSPLGSCYAAVNGPPTSWSSLVSCPPADCNDPTTVIPGTIFYRYVKLVTPAGNSSVSVSSVVTWSEKGSCNRKEQVDTYFYNY